MVNIIRGVNIKKDKGKINQKDVTKRIEAEKKLAESRSFLDTVIENSPYAMLICDEKGDLTRTNQAFRKLFQVTDAEIIGKYNILKDNIVEKHGLMKAVKDALEKGKPAQFELDYDTSKLKRLKLKNKVHKIIDASVFPIINPSKKTTNMIVQLVDITERKRFELKLLEKQQLLDEVEKIAKIGGWEMDLIARKSTWTKGTYDIVEIDYDEPIPGPDEHVFYYLPEYQPIVQNSMKRLIKDDEPIEFEAYLKTAKGNIKWCRALGRAVREKGRAVKIYGTFQDITERKNFEDKLKDYSDNLQKMVEERTKELNTAHAQLFQAAKMTAMGRMGASIAHQLNSPLCGAMLLLDSLRDSYKKPEMHDKANRTMKALKKALVSMSDVIECMLSLAGVKKLGETRRVEVDVNALLERLIETQDLELRKQSINVDTIFDQNIEKISADVGDLDQLFLNLILNAIDAMKAGGTLTLETKPWKKRGIKVIIHDSGEGISTEDMNKIFEPFFTTRPTGKGLGLGLPIIKQIVEKYSGEIDLKSKKGQWTKVTVFLQDIN